MAYSSDIYHPTYSQWYDPEKVNKKAVQLNDEAYMTAKDGEYKKAIVIIAIMPLIVYIRVSKYIKRVILTYIK